MKLALSFVLTDLTLFLLAPIAIFFFWFQLYLSFLCAHNSLQRLLVNTLVSQAEGIFFSQVLPKTLYLMGMGGLGKMGEYPSVFVLHMVIPN